MENQPEITSNQGQTCDNCSNSINSQDAFCQNCGYPQNGTKEEQAKFYRKVDAKKRLLKIIEKEVKKAKTTLVVLGVIQAIAGAVYGFVSEDMLALTVSAILAIIYFGLAIWSDKEPFGAILTGLIIYASLIIIQTVIDPTNIIRGVIWKILIIGLFVRGIKSGLEVRKVKSELSELGIKGNESD